MSEQLLGELGLPPWRYQEYLESPEWQAKRALALERDGHQCTECHRADRLEVHHITYVRLGRELLEDLVTLCFHCHMDRHDDSPWGYEADGSVSPIESVPVWPEQMHDREFVCDRCGHRTIPLCPQIEGTPHAGCGGRFKPAETTLASPP
ncbi:MAG TPA: HNH endonuclease [Actinomycetes bacterium]|jgi:hypothetical protein|nr:HNH endonuclease [Actinomycetes bacterium]